ncbi:MAG: hypothetical protein Kow0031_19340 [Anaerolineae bacterium]
MKKFFGIALILTVLLTAFPIATDAAPLKKLSWRAEYFDNPNLQGPPKMALYEATFGQDWGYGSPSPEIPVDHFSARFTRRMHFDEGTYFFFVSVDDGARVWLNGQLILDAWAIGPQRNVKSKVQIDTSGDYEIQVAYFEHTGKASIQMNWEKIADKDEILGSWRGEYFSNRNLQGSPVMVRQDSAINFDWNSGSPGARVPRDNFSVRWTRSIYLEAGHYTFRVQHDDGMRVYIDGKVIYDSWFDQEVGYEVGIVPIKAGLRTITVEFYDHIGNAVVYFNIDEDPGDYGDSVTDPNDPGIYVDNKSANFRWFGPELYEDNGGYGGNHYWTYASTSQVRNSGQWKPNLDGDGNYEVFVYIPAANSTTGNAVYRVQHFGRVAARAVNQSRYSNEWVSIGLYYFDGKGNEFVTLQDNTGEGNRSTQLAFDAVKFVKR